MKNRDLSIDALRGIAVTLMVASHTVWFLSDDTNLFWNLMRSWGDSVCFITFLFVFGISLYFSLLSKDFTEPDNRRKALKRVGLLLLAYYAIGFVSLLSENHNESLWIMFLKVATFIHVPGFTEFMPPFVFYTLFAFLYKIIDTRVHRTLPRLNLISVVVVGSLIYVAGMIVFQSTKSAQLLEIVGAYTALFINHDGFLRFALVQYFPVLLLGIYFGHVIKNKDLSEEIIRSQILSLFFVLYVIALFIWATELWTNNLYMNMYFRWPPSILFMLFGLCFALLGLWLLRMFDESRFHRIFGYLGASSMGILVFHIVGLVILKLSGVPRTSYFIYLTGYFIIHLLGFVILKQLYLKGTAKLKKRGR